MVVVASGKAHDVVFRGHEGGDAVDRAALGVTELVEHEVVAHIVDHNKSSHCAEVEGVGIRPNCHRSGVALLRVHHWVLLDDC